MKKMNKWISGVVVAVLVVPAMIGAVGMPLSNYYSGIAVAEEVYVAPTDAPTTPAVTSTPAPASTSNVQELVASDEAFFLGVNQSAKFKVYALMKDGKEVDVTSKPTTTYRSSSGTVVSVKAGLLKAGKVAGNTTITVTYGGQKLTFAVNVSAAQVKDIAVTPKTLKMNVDDSKQIKVDAIMANGTRKAVTDQAVYFSNDADVADVEEGEVTGIGSGETTIIVNYMGIEKTVAVEVNEEGQATIESLTISEKSIKLAPGKTAEVQATATYDDDTEDDVTGEVLWQSSKGSVATVVDGVITAKAVGIATITASLKGKKATFKVTVEKAKKVANIEVSSKKINVLEGKTATFKVTAVYTDRSKDDVSSKATFSVADSDLIEVKSGKIYSIDGIGSTTVTVKYEGKLVQVNVTVK